jgi:hypothetical protein
MRGVDFAHSVIDLDGPAREAAILDASRKGYVPHRSTDTWPVTLRTADGAHTLVVRVGRDVWAIGQDGAGDDFLRVPMMPETARTVLAGYDAVLPTTAIADAIYQQAELRIAPIGFGEPRSSTKTIYQSNAAIERARALGEHNIGHEALSVAGVKKDVVEPSAPGKVSIYLWSVADGKPLQTYPGPHASSYLDYSHGIRMVKRTATLDGAPVDLVAFGLTPLGAQMLSTPGTSSGPIKFGAPSSRTAIAPYGRTEALVEASAVTAGVAGHQRRTRASWSTILACWTFGAAAVAVGRRLT